MNLATTSCTHNLSQYNTFLGIYFKIRHYSCFLGIHDKQLPCYNNKEIFFFFRSMHNYLRITRILKFLGELQLITYQKEFVDFVLNQIFRENQLENCSSSCIQYWLPVVKDTEFRQHALEKYESVSESEFFFCAL